MKRGASRTPARGGRGGAEPRATILAREQEVLRLDHEGNNQHTIATTVGISQAAVSKILRRANDRWLRENYDQRGRWFAECSRKFMNVYREAMHAWEQSKGDQTQRRQRRADGTGANGNIAELTVVQSQGDPRYLEIARRALADFAGLLEIDNGQGTSTPLPQVITLSVEGDLAPRVDSNVEGDSAPRVQSDVEGELASPVPADVVRGES